MWLLHSVSEEALPLRGPLGGRVITQLMASLNWTSRLLQTSHPTNPKGVFSSVGEVWGELHFFPCNLQSGVQSAHRRS